MMDQSASNSGVNASKPKKVLIKRPSFSQNHTPERASKRKGEGCSLEPKAKHRSLIPSATPMSKASEEDVPKDSASKVGMQYDTAHDIRLFYAQFLAFHESMIGLNEPMYKALGLDNGYLKIKSQLSGYLGELHYYREKEEAMKKYKSIQD